MTPQYPYEKRPLFVDRWLNWRNTRNRHIKNAPVIVLTGAGASVPLGVPSLKLPPKIELSSGVDIETNQLVPATSDFTEQLDLESLMIVASVMKELPRNVVRHGIRSTPADREKSLAVLAFTIAMVMPKVNGKPVLSSSFVLEVAKRLIDLDSALNGKVLDGLSDAIKDLIIEGCLQLKKERIIPTYGPLLKRLNQQLSRGSAKPNCLTLPVFTTNYDETFEFIGKDLAVEISREVSAEVSVFNSSEAIENNPNWRLFRSSGYARYRPGRGTSNGLTLVVYNLHGSVTWSIKQERDLFSILVADAAAARQAKYYRALLPPDGQKVLYGKSHQGISDLFAPERKDPFRPGSIFYPMRLGYLFLESCLNHAKVVLAIGYSFRDSDCLDLLMDRWKKSEYPKVVLLDPDPEPILARLDHSTNVIPKIGEFGDESVAQVAIDEVGRHL